MSQSALAPILSWLGWAFIPGYATSGLQSLYYKLTVPVGHSPPRPGTPLFIKHYRRIRALVLVLYLFYTLLQSLYDIKLAGDFFTLLSVQPNATDREIKSRFRRLAAKYHPDKIQNNTGDEASTDSHFVLLKTAQDTLLSPALRYAYTRFGPSVLTTYHSSLPSAKQATIQNYVLTGVRYNLLPSYVMNLASLTVLNYFFLPKGGQYWRYFILTTVFVIELYFLTHTDASLTSILHHLPILPHLNVPLLPQISTYLLTNTKLQSLLPPHLLPYQTLQIFRTLSISLNIFISQLSPLFTTPSPTDNGQTLSTHLKNFNQSLSHLSSIAVRTDGESTSLLQIQMTPFKGDAVKTDRLREGMREGVVKGSLMAQPEVKGAIDRVIAQRRGGRAEGGGG